MHVDFMLIRLQIQIPIRPNLHFFASAKHPSKELSAYPRLSLCIQTIPPWYI